MKIPKPKAKVNIDKIRDDVRDFIEAKVEDLSDEEYVDILEEIEADVRGMIDCKKEELGE